MQGLLLFWILFSGWGWMVCSCDMQGNSKEVSGCVVLERVFPSGFVVHEEKSLILRGKVGQQNMRP